jgi:hypothetical protein
MVAWRKRPTKSKFAINPEELGLECLGHVGRPCRRASELQESRNKFILESHRELNSVEAIRAEIVDEIS